MGELSRERCDELLHAQALGHLGVHAAGRTYVVPIAYAWDGDTVVVHSLEGRKIDAMRRDPRVCLQVERIETPERWQSVVVQGTFEELSGAAAARALARCVERLLPPPDPDGPPRPADPFVPPHLSDRVVMFRIRPEEVTGRYMEP